MTPLRERLARLYLDREYDGDEGTVLSSAHPNVQAACYESADAATAVVADYLRDEAREIRALAGSVAGKSECLKIAVEHHALGLESIADAIDPEAVAV